MLQRLFIFLLLVLILPDIYLYLRFIVQLTAKRWLRILYWLPSVLLIAGLLYLVFFANNPFSESHTRDIGGSPSSFSCLQLPNYYWLSAPLSEYLSINGSGCHVPRSYVLD